jgi:toxin YoeB
VLAIEFSSNAWSDFQYWQTQDKKTLKRILKLIEESARTPFEGTGKPEPLRENFSGCWSRRIDVKNRMVYRVKDDRLQIIQLRYHY